MALNVFPNHICLFLDLNGLSKISGLPKLSRNSYFFAPEYSLNMALALLLFNISISLKMKYRVVKDIKP
jgi:hypothetical protein